MAGESVVKRETVPFRRVYLFKLVSLSLFSHSSFSPVKHKSVREVYGSLSNQWKDKDPMGR
jgi:hypothetical protein